MPSDAIPGYEFLVRDPRTLELIGEFRPQDITAAWTRRDLEAGGFRVVVPREQADLSMVALHSVVEVRRDAHDGLGFQTEFVGVIDSREVDEFGRTWTLEGMDLLGFWLSKRIVGATAAVQKSGPAETVLKAYVSENLGPAALPERRAASELVSLSWDVEPSQGGGNTVDYRAVRADLLAEVTVPLCRLGNLTQTVVLLSDHSGYEYRTAVPPDATVGGGGLPFSVSWDNVEELSYHEDFRGIPNVLYVLGDGSGDARNVTEVALPSSVTPHFRREAAFDARYANTLALRTDVGETELDRLDQGAVTVRGKPLRVSGNARYREDWDVGTNVTIALPQISVQVDRRIVATTVSLTRAAGEDVTFELGVQHSQSVLRRLVDRLRQLNASANA